MKQKVNLIKQKNMNVFCFVCIGKCFSTLLLHLVQSYFPPLFSFVILDCYIQIKHVYKFCNLLYPRINQRNKLEERKMCSNITRSNRNIVSSPRILYIIVSCSSTLSFYNSQCSSIHACLQVPTKSKVVISLYVRNYFYYFKISSQ